MDLAKSFTGIASVTSRWSGKPLTFIICVLLVVIWAATGPAFHYSDTWQLVINTSTTIVTFLMVFLIQSTQNRDAKATHLKLDELIRSSKARNVFADLEDATEAELDAFKAEFRKLREKRVAPGEAAEVAHQLVHKPGSH